MLWTCTGCSTAYAVGLPVCPHCGCRDHEEADMPKVSRLGGPSNAADQDITPVGDETAAVAAPGVDPEPDTAPEPDPGQPVKRRRRSTP